MTAPATPAPTATTVRDLLDRAQAITAQLLATRDPISLTQWEAFDQTLYRLLSELLARRIVGSGLVDRPALPLYDTVKTYPTPLAAIPGATEHTLADAARLIGVNRSTLRARILRGEVPATRDRDGWRIPHHSLDLRTDLCPADPTDPHPLARLAVTLGALHDVIQEHQRDPDKPDLGTGPVTRLAHDILTLTDLAARHALPLIEPDGISRVVALARHAATSTTRLAHAADAPLPYAALPPPAGHRATVTGPGVADSPPGLASVPGLLDRALADWTRASRAELAQSVPSIEVIRNITSQGVHLYATIDALLATETSGGPETVPLPDSGGPRAATAADLRVELRAAAQHLQRAGATWGPATTTVRPSPAYVDAAQQLHDTLEHTITLAPVLGLPGHARERDRALDSLTAATHDLATLSREMTPIPARLIDASILFAHARALDATTDRLRARIAGRLVPLDKFDLPDLTEAINAAEAATHEAAQAISRYVTLQRDVNRNAQPEIGPAL